MNYQKNMQQNLKYLLSLSGKNQHDFAMQYHLSDGTLSSYLNGKTTIQLDTLIRLQEDFHFSIDHFLTDDFSQTQLVDNHLQEMQRYEGLYSMYYFDPSISPNATDKKGQLEYGILYVERVSLPFQPNINQVTGLFGLDLTMLLRYWEQFKASPKIINDFPLEDGIYRYQGKMVFLDDIINFDLNNGDKDFILYSINQPRGTKSYIGGIGPCLSISRGSQRVPCMQYMACCRGLVTASPGEIADYLRFGEEDIPLHLEVRRLLRRIDDYFNPYTENQDLDTDEKELLILHHLQRLVKDTVDAQVRQFEKASQQRDYQWYQWIKLYVEENEHEIHP